MNDSQLVKLFEQALSKRGNERQAFLDSLGAQERQQIEQLLAADESAEHRGLFQPVVKGIAKQKLSAPELGSTVAPNSERGEHTAVPAQIGHYRILQSIGEGGMGSVFMAEQTEPVQRRVALKLIKPGMDSRQVIARFEAERQAMAIMNHGHIAKVFDAGVTEDGLPYFVMELVRGVAITQYCDNVRMPLKQRLSLFVQVCRAVQHAHQKGIIHRDIKPSNILVTVADGVAIPKVIDFGLAKALQANQLTEKTLVTHFGQVVGTLEYMSPEQAETKDSDVDTRSDVYSLGVLLYELLTGSTPIGRDRIRTGALHELLKLISEEEPQRPSLRLRDSGVAIAGLSANRGEDPSRISSIVRGDLDQIVMKALDKDRNRRYDGAAALADDVDRYLSDEPIEACPPSLVYRLGKAYRRHRVVFVSLICLVSMLVTGLVVTGNLWLRTRVAEADARDQAVEAKEQRATALLETQKTKLALERVEEEKSKATNAQRTTEAALARADFRMAVVRWKAGLYNDALDLLKKVPLGHRNIEWRWLRNAMEHDVVTCFGHEGTINALAFSPNGKTVASIARDGLKVWDAISGELIHSFADAPGQALAFSPDSKFLAFGTREISIWDIDTQRTIRKFRDYKTFIGSVQFSPDGTKLVTEDARFARVWDAETGEETHAFPKGSYRAVFSPDGLMVAAGGFQELGLWDLKTGDQRKGLRKSGTAMSVDLSPDGKQIGWTNLGGVFVTELESGRLRSFRSEGPSRFSTFRFSPDGKTVAATGELLQIWDRRTGETIRRFGILGGSTLMAFGPDSRRIAVSSGNRIQIIPVSLRPGTNWRKDREPYSGTIAMSSDGSLLASTGDPRMEGSGNVLIRSLPDNKLVQTIPLTKPCAACAFGDSDQLFAVCSLKSIKVYNVTTGELVNEFGPLSETVRSVALSGSGRWLATATQGQITIWNLASPNSDPKTIPTADRVRAMAFQPGTDRLVIQTTETQLRELPSGDIIQTFAANQFADVSKTRSGKRLVTGDGKRTISSAPRSVSISDTTTNEELLELTYAQMITGIGLGPNETSLYAVDFFGWTAEWPAASRTNILRVQNAPKKSAISADGSRVYTSAQTSKRDPATRKFKYSDIHEVWDAATGKIIPDATWDDEAQTRSADGRWQVAHCGTNVFLIDLNEWNSPQSQQRRLTDATPSPEWHEAQAKDSEADLDWFAAAFHRAWQLKLSPESQGARDALKVAAAKLRETPKSLLPAVAKEALRMPGPPE